ncbi:MAG: phosphonoacetaldehyde dehydrogenase [Betaproteobacteria bacterium]|jgi:phosphonoacetaldehyde dehydrogenase|nr:phosphonoacetaldehyde dehydrogenase [Betaproteobacteria bacterium]
MRIFDEAMRINGERRRRSSVIEVFDPFSARCIGTVPRAEIRDVREAIDAAAAYRPRLSRYQRSEILGQAAAKVVARTREIAELITLESGLSLQDSLYEAGRVRDVLLFGSRAALVDDGEIFSCDITPHGRERRVYTQRSPLLGVITAITPFNHPMNQVAHKVVPSIATNNRLVLKPSEKVPLSALLFADILYEVGLPPPMFQVVTGEPAEIALELLTHPSVELITFTGGASIGKQIAQVAGYRRMVLELGGNDPLIVMDDADLEEAATLAASGSYKNSGQRCTAVKRILAHESIADDFVDRLVAKTRAWSFGNPGDPSIEMGTVISERAAMLFESRVNTAMQQGAKLLVGNDRDGALYSPTVLDHVRPEMELVREETFGPVSPVIRFSDLDEAIRIANGTAFGLSSSVCTNRLDVVTKLVNELHVGTINVREVPGFRLELTPFGGIKDSGLGYKEGVVEAMKSFTTIKTYSLPWPT